MEKNCSIVAKRNDVFLPVHNWTFGHNFVGFQRQGYFYVADFPVSAASTCTDLKSHTHASIVCALLKSAGVDYQRTHCCDRVTGQVRIGAIYVPEQDGQRLQCLAAAEAALNRYYY